MKINIRQLRQIIAEEASVLRESDRELLFDKLVPEEEADRIYKALPPSFDDAEYARTVSSSRNRIPAGMVRIQVTADPGKRASKMLDAYEDYETGKTPTSRTRPEPAWKKTFETLEGETCSVTVEPDGVIVLADSTGHGFNFTFDQANKCAAALRSAAAEQTGRAQSQQIASALERMSTTRRR